jgi:[acyl-carrier-protein] S-malonyltransferase
MWWRSGAAGCATHFVGRWTESIRFIKAGGVSRFVEIGPGQVLAGLVKRIEPEVLTANVAEPGDIANL